MSKFRLLGLAFVLLSLVALGGVAETAVAQEQSCPPGRNFQGVCIQVIAFAKQPGTGECCQFATPCDVPPGFGEIFFSEEECEAAC